ncbi:unnamed protein product [Amoebophrya sp. A25]|nr:unnamed protein product [Amoebophrya sp. A25]|eukprot:GSA25T00014014001.1
MAHCGKCATRLIETAKEVQSSLIASKYLNCRFVRGAREVGGEDTFTATGKSKGKKQAFSKSGRGTGKTLDDVTSKAKLDIVSQYSVIVKVKQNVEWRSSPASNGGQQEPPWYFQIQNHPVLSSATNNRNKYQHDGNIKKGETSRLVNRGGDMWTLLSTVQFAHEHKCAQENIPASVRALVSKEICVAFSKVLDFCAQSGSASIKDDVETVFEVQHVQLWGAALPANRLPASSNTTPRLGSYLYDADFHLGVVRDWLAGDNIGAAFRSGRELADALVHLTTSSSFTGREMASSRNLGERVDFCSCSNDVSARTASTATTNKSSAHAPSFSERRDEQPLKNISAELPSNAQAAGDARSRRRARGRGRWQKDKVPQGQDDAKMKNVGNKRQDDEQQRGDLFLSSPVSPSPAPEKTNEMTSEADTNDCPDAPADENNANAKEDGDWKWAVRQRVWDYLEKHEDLARFPRPVRHRIPNFVGAEAAAEKNFATLPEFQRARVVKVNPDTPQKQIRYLTMKQGKTLMVPQPRLLKGFFSKITHEVVNAYHHGNSSASNSTGTSSTLHQNLAYLSTSGGAAAVGQPLDFDAMDDVKVDLVVIGSVAVNPRTGARIGKGEGFAEIEYGVLRMMGQIDENTPVVTHVHDCQVVEDKDIPSEKLLAHDVCVDVIVTPTRVIRIPKEQKGKPQPTGIYWELLSPQKLAQVKVLRDLKRFIQRKLGGVALPTGPDEQLPPTAERRGKGGGKSQDNNRGKGRGKKGWKKHTKTSDDGNNEDNGHDEAAKQDQTASKTQPDPSGNASTFRPKSRGSGRPNRWGRGKGGKKGKESSSTGVKDAPSAD